MKLLVDQKHLGTPESAWRRSTNLAELPAIDLGRPRKVIVVAPHPDDEVLGAGGVLQTFVASGIPIEVLAVTDGEGSHPRASASRIECLRNTRPSESELALRRLGLVDPSVTRLRLPDGQVAGVEDRVRESLGFLGVDDLVLAPWWLDGHPDHDACGRAASDAAARVGARSLHYLVWAWHWADPCGADVPWEQSRRFDFARSSRARKRWSIEAFGSQIRPLGPDPGDGPVLPPAVLRRFTRGFEVFIDRELQ